MEENNRDNKDLSERAVAAAVTPIPWKKLLSLCIIATAETINYSSIYPYVNFMVKDFGVVDDERKLGYWVGLIASSVYLANFFSSYIWGRISDRYGRRPGLLAGLIGGTILSTLLFGFSKSFYWAVTTRFLSGLLNGNTGIAKTMLGEITDKTNQARAFSLFGLTWSIGGIGKFCLQRPFTKMQRQFAESVNIRVRGFKSGTVDWRTSLEADRAISCNFRRSLFF